MIVDWDILDSFKSCTEEWLLKEVSIQILITLFYSELTALRILKPYAPLLSYNCLATLSFMHLFTAGVAQGSLLDPVLAPPLVGLLYSQFNSHRYAGHSSSILCPVTCRTSQLHVPWTSQIQRILNAIDFLLFCPVPAPLFWFSSWSCHAPYQPWSL